jgi:hypothetical protein
MDFADREADNSGDWLLVGSKLSEAAGRAGDPEELAGEATTSRATGEEEPKEEERPLGRLR